MCVIVHVVYWIYWISAKLRVYKVTQCLNSSKCETMNVKERRIVDVTLIEQW